jgi:hypothetical protein
MRAWSVVLCFVMLAAVSSGCKSKVTQENYDKIVEGMTLKEVEHFLGEGKQEGGDGSGFAAQVGVNLSAPPGGGGTQIFVWESDTKKITVTFVNGTVKTKKGF